MSRVVILQESLPHYRVPFFEGLREALALQGVRVDLVVGQPDRIAAQKQDQGSLAWATGVQVRRFGPLLWQPTAGTLRAADLVILEQANRHIQVPLLLARTLLGGPRVALWGHGGNQQRDAHSMRERVKRRITQRADWFFAYTDGSAERARQAGLPPERITVVQNAVSLGGWQETAKIRGKCVFVGGLYPAKRLRFLLEAAEMVAASRPDFRLHIIGDGPDRDLITLKQPPYVVYHGVLIGEEREQHLRQAELTLMPGLVGLVVLDAFAGRAPLVTVASQRHSPEIEYLVPGHTGLFLTKALRLAPMRMPC